MALLASGFTFAQSGILDTSFGNNGIVNIPGTGQVDMAYAVTTQSDGKIIAAGMSVYSYCIKRYNTNGSLDASFGNQGEVIQSIGEISPDIIHDVKVQPDGKIVVTGTADTYRYMFVARYNSNGTPDTGFGTNGVATWDVYPNSTTMQEVATSVFILPDGKLIMAGGVSDPGFMSRWPFIAKFNADGTPDSTFGGIGAILDTDLGTPESVACYPDGKVVFVFLDYINDNYTAVFKRYTSTGETDTSFGTNGNGIVYVSGGVGNYVSRAMTLQPDGKIVAGGMAVTTPNVGDFSVVRLNYDGSRDTTFGTNGMIIPLTTPGHDEIQQIIVQPDGKIIGAGLGHSGQSFTLARYNANGSADTGFGNAGVISTSINTESHQVTGLTLQADGRIVTSNIVYNTPDYAHFLLMRYLGGNGTAGIEELATTGIAIYPNPAANLLNISNPDNIVLDGIGILDITGKVVLQQMGNLQQIDVQNLSPGMYFLKLTTNNKEYLHKFIKQ